jgi:hypothetical protein
MSVSLSGKNALVGAMNADVKVGAMTYNNAGKAYYYNLANVGSGATSATESVILTISDGLANDCMLGRSACLDGDDALLGAYGVPSGEDYYEGAAYYYNNLASNTTGTATESLKLVASDAAGWDYFGMSVSLSNGNALVGAYAKALNDAWYTGAAYYYTNLDSASGTLTETLKLLAADARAEDSFGYRAALDGDNFLITAVYGLNSTTGAQSGKAYAGTIRSMTTLDEADGATLEIDGISFVSKTDWIVGSTHDDNTVTLASGSTADVTANGKAVSVGAGAGSSDNTLAIDGTLTATSIQIGCGNLNYGNCLRIGNGGLVKCDSLTISAGAGGENHNALVLGGGLLALSGNAEGDVETLLSEGRISLVYGDQYVTATSELLAYGYFADAELAQSFLSVENLGWKSFADNDFSKDTLVASRIMDLTWADVQVQNEGWFSSSWYGWFYYEADWARWIWSTVHGWQYVYDLADGGLCFWDDASGGWWYTNAEYYPAEYRYASNSWFYYVGGKTPNRRYWSYADGDYVNEGE